MKKTVILFFLLLINCSTAKDHYTAMNDSLIQNYKKKLEQFKIDSRDVIQITIFGEPEISGTYRVNADGFILLPWVGQFFVRGLTESELNIKFTEKIKEFLKNPQVSIVVSEYNANKIFVLGEVKSPGMIKYEDGLNIVQAISLAGGFQNYADKEETYVTRVIQNKEVKQKVSIKAIGEGKEANFLLLPGDIVYVPESLF